MAAGPLVPVAQVGPGGQDPGLPPIARRSASVAARSYLAATVVGTYPRLLMVFFPSQLQTPCPSLPRSGGLRDAPPPGSPSPGRWPPFSLPSASGDADRTRSEGREREWIWARGPAHVPPGRGPVVSACRRPHTHHFPPPQCRSHHHRRGRGDPPDSSVTPPRKTDCGCGVTRRGRAVRTNQHNARTTPGQGIFRDGEKSGPSRACRSRLCASALASCERRRCRRRRSPLRPDRGRRPRHRGSGGRGLAARRPGRCPPAP